MTVNIGSLTKKLIRVPSVHGKPRELLMCLKLIQRLLKNHNLPSKIVINEDVPCLESGNYNAEVLLLGHVDVVSGPKEMFVPRQTGSKIFGRGAFDMKGAVAAIFSAFLSLEKKGFRSIFFALTTDEEIGGHKGVRPLLKKIPALKVAIAPDGGKDFNIIFAQKGRLSLITETIGKSCHASTPWQGINAIELAAGFTKTISKEFNPINLKKKEENFSIAPTQLSSGKTKNQIPNRAQVHWDIRITSPDDKKKILKAIQRVGKRFRTKILKVNGDGFCFQIEKSNPYIQKWRRACFQVLKRMPGFKKTSSASDARFLSELDIPTIVTAPIGGGRHSDNEWVDVQSLEMLEKIVIKFISQLKPDTKKS